MSVGAQLRASREARGLTIDAVAHATRVHARVLAAIERDDLSVVPPRPFGRGFVRAYAREMGLDGERTARDYFAQFAPPESSAEAMPAAPRPANRLSRAWPIAIVSGGVLTGISLALLTGRPAARIGERPQRAPVAEPSAATPRPSVSASPGPGATGGPVAPVATADLTIVLTASRPCWVAASADGRQALYATVNPGVPQTLTAAREIVIRAGDAGALSWAINGGEPAVMGRPGQVREVRVTPATAASVR